MDHDERERDEWDGHGQEHHCRSSLVDGRAAQGDQQCAARVFESDLGDSDEEALCENVNVEGLETGDYTKTESNGIIPDPSRSSIVDEMEQNEKARPRKLQIEGDRESRRVATRKGGNFHSKNTIVTRSETPASDERMVFLDLDAQVSEKPEKVRMRSERRKMENRSRMLESGKDAAKGAAYRNRYNSRISKDGKALDSKMLENRNALDVSSKGEEVIDLDQWTSISNYVEKREELLNEDFGCFDRRRRMRDVTCKEKEIQKTPADNLHQEKTSIVRSVWSAQNLKLRRDTEANISLMDDDCAPKLKKGESLEYSTALPRYDTIESLFDISGL